jgi:hypothetical protein
VHVLSTTSARSHGDHDAQLWLHGPSGELAAISFIADFGNPPSLRTRDAGERPIILSQGDASCRSS